MATAAAVVSGASARVVLTTASATAKRATMALNGVGDSTSLVPTSSCPAASAANVPTM